MRLRAPAQTSVIIPTYNESATIVSTIAALHARSRSHCQIIVADGHSADNTRSLARGAGATVLSVPGGRAAQLNAGAARAAADTLLFLHADTTVPQAFDAHIVHALAQERALAGAFSLCIDSDLFGIRVVEKIVNMRARWLQRPYGDQGLFMAKHDFRGVGGYPLLSFLDDYVMVRKIAKKGRIVISPVAVTTSGRRWETLGVFPTTLINQLIIGAYHVGVPVTRLKAWYRGTLQRAVARHNLRPPDTT